MQVTTTIKDCLTGFLVPPELADSSPAQLCLPKSFLKRPDEQENIKFPEILKSDFRAFLSSNV